MNEGGWPAAEGKSGCVQEQEDKASETSKGNPRNVLVTLVGVNRMFESCRAVNVWCEQIGSYIKA